MRYTDVWNDLTQKMGYWVNMEDPYITYDPKYMESVWWLLKEIYNKITLQRLYHSALFPQSRYRIELS
jgi:isoleucyl-tRNA synthetase